MSERLTDEQVRKMLACAPLLPPPGGDELAKVCNALLAARARIAELERERDQARADAVAALKPYTVVAGEECWSLPEDVTNRIEAYAAGKPAEPPALGLRPVYTRADMRRAWDDGFAYCLYGHTVTVNPYVEDSDGE